jgi:hypothetical protein
MNVPQGLPATLSALLLVCSPPSIARAQEAQLEQPIVIDDEPEAFLEVAPHSMAVGMRRALADACTGIKGASIFCSGAPLRFLRAVGVTGNRKPYGFVCSRESLNSWDKYFRPDSIRANKMCVNVECYAARDVCTVDARDLVVDPDDA